MNCFVLERKHRVAKRIAKSMRNTAAEYEVTCLREVTVRHLHVLSDPASCHFVLEPCLINPKRATARVRRSLAMSLDCDLQENQVMTSRCVKFNPFEKCSVGDVVLYKHAGAALAAGQAQLHAEIADGASKTLVTVLSKWTFVSKTNRCSKWDISQDAVMILSQDILCTTIFSISGTQGSLLLPKQYR